MDKSIRVVKSIRGRVYNAIDFYICVILPTMIIVALNPTTSLDILYAMVGMLGTMAYILELKLLIYTSICCLLKGLIRYERIHAVNRINK